MKRLPSGIRFGPPWPITMVNRLGGALHRAGHFPRIGGELAVSAVAHAAKSADPAVAWSEQARRVLSKSYDEDARLSLFGALAVKYQIQESLGITAEYEGLIGAHPEILRQEIRRPLFVIGWHRTGTTLAQRLLCQHRGASYLPVWAASVRCRRRRTARSAAAAAISRPRRRWGCCDGWRPI